MAERSRKLKIGGTYGEERGLIFDLQCAFSIGRNSLDSGRKDSVSASSPMAIVGGSTYKQEVAKAPTTTSVFPKNIRTWKPVLGTVLEKVFFPGYLHFGPACWTDSDDSSAANAFDDQIGLDPDLNPAAAKGDLPCGLANLKNLATGCDVARAIVAGGVFQGVFGSIHLGADPFLEVSIKRRGHTAEKRRGDGGTAKLSILDGIDHGGHPAAAD